STVSGTGTVTSSGTPLIHQIPIWTTATNLIGLANGTTGQFLGANTGADPSWQTPSGSGGGGFQITTVYKFAGTSGTAVMTTGYFSSASAQQNQWVLDNTATAASTFTTPTTSPGNANCITVANGSSGFTLTILANTGFTINGGSSGGSITIGKSSGLGLCMDASGTNYKTSYGATANGSQLANAMTATDAGSGANAYSITPGTPPSAGLTTNVSGYFIPAHANTGASTLNWAG